MVEKPSFIGETTLVQLGTVIGLLLVLSGAAYSYGVMYTKVETVVQRVASLDQKVDTVNNKMDTLIIQSRVSFSDKELISKK